MVWSLVFFCHRTRWPMGTFSTSGTTFIATNTGPGRPSIPSMLLVKSSRSLLLGQLLVEYEFAVSDLEDVLLLGVKRGLRHLVTASGGAEIPLNPPLRKGEGWALVAKRES